MGWLWGLAHGGLELLGRTVGEEKTCRASADTHLPQTRLRKNDALHVVLRMVKDGASRAGRHSLIEIARHRHGRRRLAVRRTARKQHQQSDAPIEGQTDGGDSRHALANPIRYRGVPDLHNRMVRSNKRLPAEPHQDPRPAHQQLSYLRDHHPHQAEMFRVVASNFIVREVAHLSPCTLDFVVSDGALRQLLNPTAQAGLTAHRHRGLDQVVGDLIPGLSVSGDPQVLKRDPEGHDLAVIPEQRPSALVYNPSQNRSCCVLHNGELVFDHIVKGSVWSSE